MGKFKDLTGQKFGRWTVLHKAEDRHDKSGRVVRYWTCKCECGTIRDVPGRCLRDGSSKSCGCYHKDKVKNNIIDMTGKKINNLTVIKRVDDHIAPDGKHYVMWECKCDCGNIIITRGTALRGDNAIQSCGCLRIKNAAIAAAASKKYNDYDLSGDYGIGYTSNTNKEFYFDLEDYDKIKDYTWYESTGGYIRAHKQNTGGIPMHKLIMLGDNWRDTSVDVDHRRGNNTRSDNRKENLRMATPQENSRNKTHVCNNTSGFIGVSFRKDRNKWRAYINVNKGEQLSLGQFSEFTDAVRARIEAELKYFGEFSYYAHKKVLDYILNGGTLDPYNRKQIENIMNN